MKDYAFNRITIILKITTNLLVTVETVLSFIKSWMFVFWIWHEVKTKAERIPITQRFAGV